MLRKSILALTLGALTAMLSVEGLAAPLCADVFKTTSEKLAWLEKDSPERLAMVRERNGDVLESLKDSQLKEISNKLQNELFKAEGSVLQSSKLRSGKILILKDRGFGKSTDLILKDGENEKVLFSNFDEARNNSVRLLNFSVSPDQKWIVAVYSEKGNIDRFFAKIYSLKDRTLREARLPMMGVQDSKIAWDNPASFYYQEERGQDHRVKHFDVESSSSQLSDWAHFVFQSKDGYSVVSGKDGGYYLLNGQGKVRRLNLQNEYVDFVGVYGDSLLFRTQKEDGTGAIETLSAGQRKSRVFTAREGRVLNTVSIIGKHIAVSHFLGADRQYEILNSDGQIIAELKIPTGLNILKATWEKPGKVLNLEFGSKLKKNGQLYSWDLRTELDLQKISKAMHRDGNVTYVSHIEEVMSADGTLIPMRLTHRKDLVLDGANPSLVSVYGGFGVTGMMHNNQYFVMEKAFLEKGGILVAPAIRGGNEFGKDWHEQGRGIEGKNRGLEDTIAVGKWLAENNYSAPAEIIIRGGSNGGFVVAAAAQKSPGTFGLVIPTVGLHDMLGKERLDLDNSFKEEYGDATQREQAPLMQKFSPIEFNSQGNPTEFFIVSGAVDSRVNAVHSDKLSESLRDQGIKSNLFTIKNAGHFAESSSAQNTIGWRTQSIIWAKIFQFAGLEF